MPAALKLFHSLPLRHKALLNIYGRNHVPNHISSLLFLPAKRLYHIPHLCLLHPGQHIRHDVCFMSLLEIFSEFCSLTSLQHPVFGQASPYCSFYIHCSPDRPSANMTIRAKSLCQCFSDLSPNPYNSFRFSANGRLRSLNTSDKSQAQPSPAAFCRQSESQSLPSFCAGLSFGSAVHVLLRDRLSR